MINNFLGLFFLSFFSLQVIACEKVNDIDDYGNYILLDEDLLPLPKSHYILTTGPMLNEEEFEIEEIRLAPVEISSGLSSIIIRHTEHDNIDWSRFWNIGEDSKIERLIVEGYKIYEVMYEEFPEIRKVIYQSDYYQVVVLNEFACSVLLGILKNKRNLDH